MKHPVATRTQSIMFRVTPAEREQLEVRAEQAGMTLSQYTRHLCFADPDKWAQAINQLDARLGLVEGILKGIGVWP